MAARDCSYWIERWDQNEIGFHKPTVHQMLIKHQDKLFADGKPKTIFVPLCGKTLDLKWFADQDIQTTGLDVAEVALKQVFTENGLEWEEKPIPLLGESGKLLHTKDGKLKLYCGDMMKFSKDVAGTFDAIWDRGALVALPRADIKRYSQILMNVLKPCGRMLVELMQYNLSIMDDIDPSSTKPPPPFPMYEEDLKDLYGSDCSVEFVDSENRTLQGKDIVAATYLVVKK